MRDMLFLSHANPEDNEFSLWLALQLAKEGYPVWCDLTRLLGGHDFWKDIEQAIRERTVKFLYVLSKKSNVKDGPLQELQVAKNIARQHKLKDFIIPLHIDDLPHREINIQLARIISVPFYKGWADGLKALLQKLEEDDVQKSTKFSPEAVTSWWKLQFDSDQGVARQPEEYLSNWFLIQDLPSHIHLHTLKRSSMGLLEIPDDLPYPACQHGLYIVSFAEKDAFEGKLGSAMSVSDTHTFSVEQFLNGNTQSGLIDWKQARNIITYLLRAGWEKFLRDHSLPTYTLAHGGQVFYFSKGLIKDDKISFTGVSRKKTYRNVIGYKTIGAKEGLVFKKRFWHFGIQSKPMIYPSPAYIIKPHVIFSDDGFTIWESKDSMHRARRSQCKNWWNPDWRDRILATMTWLSTDAGNIEIKLGKDIPIHVSNLPLTFSSPVSFADPAKDQPLIDGIFDEEDKFDDFDEIEGSDD